MDADPRYGVGVLTGGVDVDDRPLTRPLRAAGVLQRNGLRRIGSPLIRHRHAVDVGGVAAVLLGQFQRLARRRDQIGHHTGHSAGTEDVHRLDRAVQREVVPRLRAHPQLADRALPGGAGVRVERVEPEQHVVDVGDGIEVTRYRISDLSARHAVESAGRAYRRHHVEVAGCLVGAQADSQHDDAAAAQLIGDAARPADRLHGPFGGVLDTGRAVEGDPVGVGLGRRPRREIDLAVGEPCDRLAALSAVGPWPARRQLLAGPVERQPVIGVDTGVLGGDARQLRTHLVGRGPGQLRPILFARIGVGEPGGGDLEIRADPIGVSAQRL